MSQWLFSHQIVHIRYISCHIFGFGEDIGVMFDVLRLLLVLIVFGSVLCFYICIQLNELMLFVFLVVAHDVEVDTVVLRVRALQQLGEEVKKFFGWAAAEDASKMLAVIAPFLSDLEVRFVCP